MCLLFEGLFLEAFSELLCLSSVIVNAFLKVILRYKRIVNVSQRTFKNASRKRRAKRNRLTLVLLV